MKPDPEGNWQWELVVTVYHGPNFGHRIEIVQTWRGRQNHTKIDGGSWRGLGIPADVLYSLRATVDSLLSEHLITRYQLREELPLKWEGAPDPF
jgi:hypothetical protein